MGALVGVDEQGEFLFCSGTLIAPDVFLTAAHCTAAIEQFGFEFRGVTFDSVFDPDTSVVYPGTPYTHPEFPGPSSDAKDIAVVVLDEEVAGIQPALLPSAGLLDQLANDDALKGQRFTAVGYGATERTHEPGSGAPVFGEDGTRMYSVSTFAALIKTFLRLSQNPSTGDAGTCYGDSGGSNFLDDSRVIASITITGDIACRATNVTYRLDTPTARAFLGQFVTLPLAGCPPSHRDDTCVADIRCRGLLKPRPSIHRSAWKVRSANFALTEFSEVPGQSQGPCS